MRKEMYPKECKVCGYVRIDDNERPCKNENTGKFFGHDDFLRIIANDSRSYSVEIKGELPRIPGTVIKYKAIELFMCPNCGVITGKV